MSCTRPGVWHMGVILCKKHILGSLKPFQCRVPSGMRYLSTVAESHSTSPQYSSESNFSHNDYKNRHRPGQNHGRRILGNSPEQQQSKRDMQKQFVERGMESIRNGGANKLDPRQISHLIRNISEQKNIEYVFEVLDAAFKSFRADQYVIESALQACFVLNQIDRVKDVLAMLQENEVVLSDLVISAIINGYCSQGKPDIAFESFQIAQEKGMAISSKENILLESLLEHNMLEQAHTVLKAMVANSEKYKYPNEATWLAVAKACSMKNQHLPLQLYDEYVGDRKKLSPSFWKALIQNAFNRNDMKKALEIWTLAKKYSAPEALPYSAMISALNKAGSFEKVLETFEEMKAANIDPEEAIFHAVLSSCVKTSRLDQSREVLNSMSRAGVKPGQTAYMIVLEGFVKGNEFPKAMSLLEDMKQDNVKPSSTMWSVIIHGLGKATQLDRALSILNDLKSKHPLEFVTYGSVLNSLFKTRLGEYSVQQLDELRKLGINCDDNLKNAVLHTVNEGQDGVQGNFNSVLDEMDAAGTQPDEIMFNILLDNCVKKRRIDQAREVLERMQNQYHITPSRVTWCIFLKGLGVAGLLGECVRVYNEKLPAQSRTQYEYNIMIHQMIKNNRLDLAVKYFDEMNVSGVEPSEITANILMNGIGRAKDLNKCFEVFDAFRVKLNKMSAISYNVLMSCCMMNKRPDRAVQLLEDMRGSGVQPISFLGWNRATEGITLMNKIEQSFDLVKKDKTGIAAYTELLKVCVECGRKDLVVKATEYMQAANVSWDAVKEQLKGDPVLLAKIELWLQEEGELPLNEEQLKKLDEASLSAA